LFKDYKVKQTYVQINMVTTQNLLESKSSGTKLSFLLTDKNSV